MKSVTTNTISGSSSWKIVKCQVYLSVRSLKVTKVFDDEVVIIEVGGIFIFSCPHHNQSLHCMLWGCRDALCTLRRTLFDMGQFSSDFFRFWSILANRFEFLVKLQREIHVWFFFSWKWGRNFVYISFFCNFRREIRILISIAKLK